MGSSHGGPKLYSDLASWWTLLSPPSEYTEEAGLYEQAILEACEKEPRTLLELGCGGGHNASHLKNRFQMTLVDLSPQMIEMSRKLNPECEHLLGDMRSVRLGREFDAVFIHDAVSYMTSEADVRQTIETAYLHCRLGGAVLIAPDHVRENFEPSTDSGGTDGDGRGLRYLEWTWDPDPDDTMYLVDFAYLLRERDGSVEVVHDRHVEGVFARGDWLRWMTERGLQVGVVQIEHTNVEAGFEAFVGRKTAGVSDA